MDEADRKHALRRKARSGREEHQARVMRPPRALRLALARVADALFGLELTVSSIHASEAGQEGAIAGFAEDCEDWLTVVLDGPEGAVGAASADPGLFSGLIEMQTMGRIAPRAPHPRPPTQTDAALVAPLLDGMLAEFAQELEGGAAAGWAAGYRFGAMIEGPRMLRLLFEAPDFHLFRLQVSLGGGVRSGELVLALPAVSPEGEDAAQAQAMPGAAAAAEEARQLGQGALMEAEARLTAVLHRLRLPLSDIAGLKPGALLPVPREALGETRLEAAGGRGGGIACRLGQADGFRAVRLRAAPAPGASRAPDGPEHGDAGAEGADDPRALGGGAAAESMRDAPAPTGRPEAAETAPGRPAPTDTGDPPVRPDGAALTGAGDLPEVGGLDDLPDLSDLPELALGR